MFVENFFDLGGDFGFSYSAGDGDQMYGNY